MSRRRVVVTGLGCISPVGNTVADSWTNLLAGVVAGGLGGLLIGSYMYFSTPANERRKFIGS